MKEQDGVICMMKGEHLLNEDFPAIDSIKEKTGVDITIFYQDTRVITTIRTNDGVRYFSYYEPLYASDGVCIGMIFLGKSAAQMESLVCGLLVPIIVFGILTVLTAFVVTVRFSSKLVMAIRKTELFLETVAGGSFTRNLMKMC